MNVEDLRRRDEELARVRKGLESAVRPLSDLGAVVELARSEVERAQSDPSYVAVMARRNAQEADRLAKAKAQLWRDKVAKSCPVKVAARVMGELKHTPAIAFVDDWFVDRCATHLVLRGGVGTGKSTAACVAIMRWLEPVLEVLPGGEIIESLETRDRLATWLRPDGLISAIKHSYDEKSPKLNRYVVVDDMGTETRGPEFVDSLCELLDRDGHTLLITTNLTRPQMLARYDLRLLDRLSDTAIANDVPGESMRKQQGDFL